MRAMVLHQGTSRLVLEHLLLPECGPQQVRLRVEACGVCRTDLHIVDGDLKHPTLPLIPGHQIVGRISEIGADVRDLVLGQRVGVPWLGHTCGHCKYCRTSHENLCDAPGFTGYTRNGGFAEECLADAAYVFALPDAGDPVRLAPLLCAGLIGYRSYRMTGDAKRLGFYDFGAQVFARDLGAVWAGGSDQTPDVALDAAILFAPVGALVSPAR